MEQLTGPTNLDFPYRSLIASQLAPGRDQGIAMHGRFLRRGLGYEIGLFRGDGDNANIRFFEQIGDEAGPKADIRTGLRTVAARLTGTPLRLLKVPAPLKELELGGAFTTSAVPEGIKGLRGRSYSKNLLFRHIDVKGERLRLGTELRWTPGPFSLKSEFIHVRDQRKGQGITGNDLPDLISRGWYVSGTWVVTGQSHAQRDEPKNEFLLGRGLGAVELAGRYESMRFGSSAHPGRPSRTPRAANILGNSDRAWTFGVNWYWNRFVKVQLNGIREQIEDPERSPIFGRQTFWIGLCRLQVVM
jgi:phosphate-selective porin OprO/OprP